MSTRTDTPSGKAADTAADYRTMTTQRKTIVINSADKQTVMPRADPQPNRVRKFNSWQQELLKEYGATGFAVMDGDRPDDLIHGVVGGGAKWLMSGPAKSGKTSVLVDAAVTLTATEPNRFLGHFPRHEECSVRFLLCNYEMDPHLLQHNIEIAARSKGVEIDKAHLIVLNRPPKLGTDWGMEELGKILDGFNPNVAAVDSFYAATDRKIDPKNYTNSGGFLTEISDLCHKAGATPLIVTHANRDRRAEGLASISGSGFAEWTSDWLLLRRIGKFDAATGHSKIRVEIGSRAGHGGVFTLDVHEGRPSSPGGRVWETAVSQAGTSVTTTEDASSVLCEAVLKTLAEDGPATKNDLRVRLKRSSAEVTAALEALTEDGTVEQTQATKRGQMVTLYGRVEGGRTVE